MPTTPEAVARPPGGGRRLRARARRPTRAAWPPARWRCSRTPPATRGPSSTPRSGSPRSCATSTTPASRPPRSTAAGQLRGGREHRRLHPGRGRDAGAGPDLARRHPHPDQGRVNSRRSCGARVPHGGSQDRHGGGAAARRPGHALAHELAPRAYGQRARRGGRGGAVPPADRDRRPSRPAPLTTCSVRSAPGGARWGSRPRPPEPGRSPWPPRRSPTTVTTFTPDPATRIRDEYGELAAQALTCAMHLHVDVSDDEEAIAVTDRIRPGCPVLLALSANSPYWQRRDTAHASWRSQVWSRWPSAGPAEPFGDPAGYRASTEQMLQEWGAASTRGCSTSTPGWPSTSRPWRSGWPTCAPRSTTRARRRAEPCPGGDRGGLAGRRTAGRGAATCCGRPAGGPPATGTGPLVHPGDLGTRADARRGRGRCRPRAGRVLEDAETPNWCTGCSSSCSRGERQRCGSGRPSRRPAAPGVVVADLARRTEESWA